MVKTKKKKEKWTDHPRFLQLQGDGRHVTSCRNHGGDKTLNFRVYCVDVFENCFLFLKIRRIRKIGELTRLIYSFLLLKKKIQKTVN